MLFYIDPGTGSMLFTILIAILGSLVYFLRDARLKIGSLLRRNKVEEAREGKHPFVFFSESKRYWNTFGPICDEMEKRGQEVLYLTESPDDPALTKGYSHIHCEYIGEGNRAFAKLNFLKADVLFATTPGLDVYQWKRSKDVSWYVHLPHAPNDITLYRMFGLDYYDAVLLSGEYQVRQIRTLEKLRNLPAKELVITGIPYMDSMKQRLETAGAGASHERTVLLAPSWGESAMLSRYGERILRALLDTGYHIIVRPHPQSFTSEKEMLDRLMKAFPDNSQLEWNRDSDNFDVLSRSDIMISDFSGVIFDYALVFDKPILYADTAFDSAPYDACWISDELWTFQVLPTLGEQITEDRLSCLKDVIDHCLADTKYREARDQARRETWLYEGEGASRVADYLIACREKLLSDSRKETVWKEKGAVSVSDNQATEKGGSEA